MADAKSTTVAPSESTPVATSNATISPMKTLGDRLRYLRQKNRDTQLALADIAGVTKQAISKIERVGVIDSASSTLEPIARRYGVSLRWLMTGTGPKEEPATESRSQPVRLDPEIVRDVAQALQEVFEEDLGLRYSITDEPELFAEMYARTVATGSVDSRSNILWLGGVIERRIRQGDGDGKGKGTNDQSDASRAPGRNRAKA